MTDTSSGDVEMKLSNPQQPNNSSSNSENSTATQQSTASSSSPAHPFSSPSSSSNPFNSTHTATHSPSTSTHTPRSILKKHNSRKRSVQWDEGNLNANEEYRLAIGPRMKIAEPKTPYTYSSMSGCESPGRLSIDGSLEVLSPGLLPPAAVSGAAEQHSTAAGHGDLSVHMVQGDEPIPFAYNTQLNNSNSAPNTILATAAATSSSVPASLQHHNMEQLSHTALQRRKDEWDDSDSEVSDTRSRHKGKRAEIAVRCACCNMQ